MTTRLQRTPELDHDDPGHDPLMAADATAMHRASMLDLVEESLERPMSSEARAKLVEMRKYWDRGLSRRLHQLATGTKPTSTLLADPPDHPAILAGIAAAAQMWSPANAIALR